MGFRTRIIDDYTAKLRNIAEIWDDMVSLTVMWRNGVQDVVPRVLEFIGQEQNIVVDSATGRMQLAIHDPGTINVQDPPYNAKGDGITDDTAAIDAALAYLETLPTGGTLFFPPGHYKRTTTLTIHTENVRLEGAAHASTIYFTGTGNAIEISPEGTAATFKSQLRDLVIIGTATCTNGVYIGSARAYITNVRVASCSHAGFMIAGGDSHVMRDCFCSHNYDPGGVVPEYGLYIGDATAPSNWIVVSSQIHSMTIEGVSKTGIHIEKASQVYFYGGTSEANRGYGMYLGADSNKIVTNGMHFELNRMGNYCDAGSNNTIYAPPIGQILINATNPRVIGDQDHPAFGLVFVRQDNVDLPLTATGDTDVEARTAISGILAALKAANIIGEHPVIGGWDWSQNSAGTAAWTTMLYGGPFGTMSKVAGPDVGTQALRVTHLDNQLFSVMQQKKWALLTGRTYRFQLKIRGDGTSGVAWSLNDPFMQGAANSLGGVFSLGTNSDGWTTLDVTHTMALDPDTGMNNEPTNVLFVAQKALHDLGWFEVGPITITDMMIDPVVNLIQGGDFEADMVGHFTFTAGQVGRVAGTRTGGDGVWVAENQWNGSLTYTQFAATSVMVVGCTYYLEGWARGTGNGAYPVLFSGADTVWTGTDSTEWQHFIIPAHVATDTQFNFYGVNLSAAGTVHWDDVVLTEVTQ